MAKSKKNEYLELKKTELVSIAKELGLAGLSKFSKEELVDAIIAAEKTAKTPSSKSRTAASAVKQAAKIEKAKPAAKAEDSKTSAIKSDAPVRTKTQRKKAAGKPVENGFAVQHPSASPSALKYSRYSEDEAGADAAVWPDRSSVPERYGRDRLLLLARDPYHLFCMWEISPAKLGALARSMPEEKWNARRQVLRLFRTTTGMSTPIVTADVFGEVGRFHIEIPYANATYHVELGYYFPDGSYTCALSTHPMRSPQDSPPALAPVRWMTVTPLRYMRMLSLKTEHAANGSVSKEAMRREIEEAIAQRRLELGIPDGPLGSSDEGAHLCKRPGFDSGHTR